MRTGKVVYMPISFHSMRKKHFLKYKKTYKANATICCISNGRHLASVAYIVLGTFSCLVTEGLFERILNEPAVIRLFGLR